MKFVKSVEVLIGVAATSGIALMLSGSAYAADAGTSTSSQTIAATHSDAVVVDASHVSTTSVNGGVEQPKAQVGGLTEVDSAATTSAKSAATDLPSVAASVGGSVAKPAVAVFGTSDKPVADVAAHADAVVPGVVNQTQETIDAPVMRPEATQHVVFNSTVLPIQPKITMIRAAYVDDLASSVPTAPELAQMPERDPAPSQPTGVFTRLTSVLAGSVLPQTFVASAEVAATTLVPAALIGVLVLLLGTFVQSYGSWLRETGFLNAARSDASGANNFSLFATPLVLSYAAPQGHIHSSFLMVSETKTVMVPNAYRKEETK